MGLRENAPFSGAALGRKRARPKRDNLPSHLPATLTGRAMSWARSGLLVKEINPRAALKPAVWAGPGHLNAN